MNNQNNTGIENNKPRLKKVKRPIRKIQPQMQQNALQNINAEGNNADFDISTNPFQSKTIDQQSQIDPFSIGGIANNTQIAKTNTSNNDYTPQFITDENEYEYNNAPSGMTLLPDKKTIIIASIVAFLIGFMLAKIFGGEQKIVNQGLQGVILNAEVPQGRARCGKAPSGQGCVLYIMNPQRQELNARDFYDLAAQLTGRQRFVIETGNMRYSNIKIRPGEIGQFNIPPLTQ